MSIPMRPPIAGIVLCALLAPAAWAEPNRLSAAVDGDHRTPEYTARDAFRHPMQTLTFFGIRDDMTVVEISPGEGWYTEILAHYLRDSGKLYAANYDLESEQEYYRRNAQRFLDKLAAEPQLYDQVVPTVFDPPAKLDAAPPGSADLVLTFRNLHNWMLEGSHEEALAGMHSALKPGGILGIVQHRGRPDIAQDPNAGSGYIREDYVIDLVEAAGFEFVARSEINANPRDTRDHPEGVWTLPPGYELGDLDREKYAAIGESDRMTLKFVKKP
ncbi:MAG: methyltransferase [Gammaproteobacteria bacterium]|nr:methyltransferase [Gammaproteobacteria bacterium]